MISYFMRQTISLKNIKKTNIRNNFDINDNLSVEDIVKIHIDSFEYFIQQNANGPRKNQGLEKIFLDFFPIVHKNIELAYINYSILSPNYTVEECVERGVDYASTVNVNLILKDLITKEEKEITVSFGSVPIINDRGSFIINGHERILIFQLLKSPGLMCIEETDGAKEYLMAKLHPNSGVWIYIHVENDTFFISIDRKKKFPLISFLLCFAKDRNLNNPSINGYDLQEILSDFYTLKIAKWKNEEFFSIDINARDYQKQGFVCDVYKDGEKITSKNYLFLDEWKNFIGSVDVKIENIDKFFLGEDICENNVIKIETGSLLDKNIFNYKKDFYYWEINDKSPNFLLNSLNLNNVSTKDQALNVWEVYSKLSSSVGLYNLNKSFNIRFTDLKYYDLDIVGRLKLNKKLNINRTESYITYEDITHVIKKYISTYFNETKPDIIDSLVNKRIKTPANMLENLFRLGMIRFERNFKERSNTFEQNLESLSDIINLRIALYPVLDGFYKYAQMADNTNRLSYLAHLSKVKIGTLGTGNNRVADSIRMINATQLDMLCTLQTPEGQNVGLISYIAKNTTLETDTGFLFAPFYKIENGKVIQNIVYLSAEDIYDQYVGSIYNFKYQDGEYLPKEQYLLAKYQSEAIHVPVNKLNFISIVANELFGFCSSVLPFPGNSDPTRLAVAANMTTQCQNLQELEAPFVSTGMDGTLGEKIKATKDGIVKRVDANRIIIFNNDNTLSTYDLIQNKKTNTETCLSHYPLVDLDQKIKSGDIIADGFSTKHGELAIGKNLLCAFINHPYTFEDAILLSKSVANEEKLSSLNIQELQCLVKDTRVGPEEVTADVYRPNSTLDEYGVIYPGSILSSGDVIVGKVTPLPVEKAINDINKLIAHIQNDSSKRDSRDSSLKAKKENEGVVLKTKILYGKADKQKPLSQLQNQLEIEAIEYKMNEKIEVLNECYFNDISKIDLKKNQPELYEIYLNEVNKIKEDSQKQIKKINSGYQLTDVLQIIKVTIASVRKISVGDKLTGRYGNKGVISRIENKCDMPFLKDGTPVEIIFNTIGLYSRMNWGQIFETQLGYAICFHLRKEIELLLKNYDSKKDLSKLQENVRYAIGEKNFELYNLTNEKNLLEIADHLVDNGIYITIPQFSDFSIKDIEKILKDLNLDESGKVDLYDGTTGEKFIDKVLVGYKYILKLEHMILDKIHARSIGKYNLINNQPLGGKAHFGGQRLGEMEVWAIAAFGSAFFVYESLNLKSDDSFNRQLLLSHLYNNNKYSIILNNLKKIVPTFSWKVLVSNLQAAGFNIFIENME